MVNAKKSLLSVLGVLFVWCCILAIGIPVVMMLTGCAGSSSDITPAKSLATDKSLVVTPTAKRKMRLTVTVPGVPAVESPVVEEGASK